VSGHIAERLRSAMNDHDIDRFVGLFDERYRSEQPAHPDRAFTGRDQVRENWSSEWRWTGTHADGSPLDMAGVIVFGVRDDRLAWARLYVEPVELEGAGIDAAVRRMAGSE
jgi:hypothetical protein